MGLGLWDLDCGTWSVGLKGGTWTVGLGLVGLGWDLVITRPNLSNLFHMLSVGSLNIHESRSISSFIIRVRPSSQQSKNSKMFQTSKHLPKKKPTQVAEPSGGGGGDSTPFFGSETTPKRRSARSSRRPAAALAVSRSANQRRTVVFELPMDF